MTDLKQAFNISYTQINNNYQTFQNTEKCSNHFGNYFQTCSTPSAQWGSSTEENDINVSMNQSVCHHLFNNSTKRKSIVKYSRN